MMYISHFKMIDEIIDARLDKWWESKDSMIERPYKPKVAHSYMHDAIFMGLWLLFPNHLSLGQEEEISSPILISSTSLEDE